MVGDFKVDASSGLALTGFEQLAPRSLSEVSYVVP